jgi:hypothetical protein
MAPYTNPSNIGDCIVHSRVVGVSHRITTESCLARSDTPFMQVLLCLLGIVKIVDCSLGRGVLASSFVGAFLKTSALARNDNSCLLRRRLDSTRQSNADRCYQTIVQILKTLTPSTLPISVTRIGTSRARLVFSLT